MINKTYLDNLQTELWDMYKDVNDRRPRHWTVDQWDSIEFLETQRELLLNILNAKTFKNWTVIES